MLIDFLEHRALVPGGAFEFFQFQRQFGFGNVQEADLELVIGFGVAHQVMQPAPGRFELLQFRVVQDRVDLARQLGIDRRNHRLQRTQGVVRDQLGCAQCLGRQGVDGAAHGKAGLLGTWLEFLQEPLIEGIGIKQYRLLKRGLLLLSYRHGR
ncbi:hypothetical protein D3C77_192330 [compost metagenome]